MEAVRIDRVSEFNLRHVVNPVPEGSIDNEEESAQPERPAFSATEENYADYNSRDT